MVMVVSGWMSVSVASMLPGTCTVKWCGESAGPKSVAPWPTVPLNVSVNVVGVGAVDVDEDDELPPQAAEKNGIASKISPATIRNRLIQSSSSARHRHARRRGRAMSMPSLTMRYTPERLRQLHVVSFEGQPLRHPADSQLRAVSWLRVRARNSQLEAHSSKLAAHNALLSYTSPRKAIDMTQPEHTYEDELVAMRMVAAALQNLRNDHARWRVLRWALEHFPAPEGQA